MRDRRPAVGRKGRATGEPDASAYRIETRRLESGPVGRALAHPDHPATELARSILEGRDRGDGWIVLHDTGGTWYPGRVAVDIRAEDRPEGPPALRVDTAVVESTAETADLRAHLNELNVQACGWWWWFDPASHRVTCSMTVRADARAWWWPSILHGLMPLYATAIESMADCLADRHGGVVRVAEHPVRGARPEVDGFITGIRESPKAGPREMRASVDLWLSTLDLSRLHHALQALGHDDVQVDWPLRAVVHDTAQQPRVVLRRHWHATLGWGWQLATLSGILANGAGSTADLHRVASLMNARQHGEADVHDRLGGWVAFEEIGLVHLTFVPALEIERVIDSAEDTAGNVAALMMDVETRRSDLAALFELARPSLEGPLTMFDVPEDETDDALRMSNLRAGPIGWPYLDQRVQRRVLDGWNGEDPPGEEDADTWLLPRHVIIASFGVFNPMGPTVSSLEAAFVPGDGDGGHWSLFWLLRHPSSPAITYLGSAPDPDGLQAIIVDSLAATDPDRSVLGSGPHWLDIHRLDAAVLEGARRFARAQPDTDWRTEALSLVVHSSDPWAQILQGVSGEELDWPTDLDDVEGWLQAITDPDVIAGHQLFLRSAWAGAVALSTSSREVADAAQAATTAQAAANALMAVARARAMADFELRARVPPIVKHPAS